jgi:hypothetical protein
MYVYEGGMAMADNARTANSIREDSQKYVRKMGVAP